MKKKGFKVLRSERGMLLSCVAAGRKPWKGSRRYIKGKETKRARHAGPLTLFKSLKSAENFVTKLYGTYGWRSKLYKFVIYECTYSRYTGASKHLWMFEISDGVVKYRNHAGLYEMVPMPKGTIFAETITITKKVKISLEQVLKRS